MSVHELVIALDFFYAVLSADATLLSYAPGGVWRGLAPPMTAVPFVIIAFQSGVDTLTINAIRLMTQPLYQVKACGPASGPTSQMAQISKAAAEIDAILKRTAGTTVGGYVGACYREAPVLYDDPVPVNGALWTNIGGLYRLEIQQTT